MKLELKKLWASEARQKEEAKEFVNIRDWWNAHDGGFRRWTLLNTLGSFTTGIVSKAAAYTIGINDQIIFVDSTLGGITVTLPTSIGLNGRRYTIKDWKGQSGANNITIATTAAQTIDGAATKVLNANYASYTVVSDGANWAVI